MSEGADVGEDTGGTCDSCVPSTANKENGVGVANLYYSALGAKGVASAATQCEGWGRHFHHSSSGGGFATPFALSSTLAPHSTLTPAAAKTTEGVTQKSLSLETTEPDSTMSECLSSLMSEFGRTRRRRRREQLTLENSVDGEKQVHDLEQALQSLEEMQRENKERMRLGVSYASCNRTWSPNERNPEVSERPGKHLVHFFRTQSVDGLVICEKPKRCALKRVMTSSAMPEPNPTTPIPVPLQTQHENSPIHGKSSSPPNRRVSSAITKASGFWLDESREFDTPFARKESKLQTSPSLTTKVARESTGTAEKHAVPPRSNPSPPSRGLATPHRVSSGGGPHRPSTEEKKAVNSHCSLESITNGVDAEGKWCASPVIDDGKGTCGETNSGKKANSGKRCLLRRVGRSTSPPIIILTVDSRRNMGEENARRLLSAEPIRSPELLARLMPHNSSASARPAVNNVPKKHSPEKAATRSVIVKSMPRSPIEEAVSQLPTTKAASRSPTTKELLSDTRAAMTSESTTKTVAATTAATAAATTAATAAAKATVPKDSPPREAAKTRVPIQTRNSFLGMAPAAPAVSSVVADKPKVEERQAPWRQPASQATQPSLGKYSEVLEVLVSTGAASKTSTSPTDRNAASFPMSKQRKIKTTNGLPKTTVVFSVEPKTKTRSQPETHLGGSVHAPLAVMGQAAAATMRRRASGAATRFTSWCRDEPASALDKDVHRGTKGKSSMHSSEAGSSAPKPPTLQQLSRRRKSLSVLTYESSFERDACGPLNTDRRRANRVRAVRCGPIGEIQSPKQLVPFCTECGKRHLSEKVKFCAFCGHKRESVG
ncbi:hypothetical protein TraAM80_00531 [Trypanosoma rangeli]|uniref:Zinc-ribbon domain-containing protein n=1 Tax=Trypanosoma rangeli TaxID=5698 RepID=A0A3R7MAS5_TRYRA|nr:uncharacterized protein TraAM80_00531 [Trypanosoma rangeli]RNF12110.1 hypothetical protein TraAM80_00531 [Trypanosoma rangeli]|eukprot:RNF12110.1 hypothetical protein TraAM80_00531 [Trypanosoma rangeli]